MKLLFIILDGVGDRPLLELDGKTPLEYANTPNLNVLAKQGLTGIMDIISPGVTPGSDTAHLALFGVDPFKYYTGRGPFEAAGVGLQIKEGDVAFRVNFATLENGIIIDRRAGRIKERTYDLVESLKGMEFEGVEVIIADGTEHRAATILRGEGLSDKVKGNDPKIEGKEPYAFKALDNSPESQKTVRVLNAFKNKAHYILQQSEINKEREEKGLVPANYLLIRGAGKVPKLPNFEKEYGLKTVCVAGGVDTNLQIKFETAYEMLKNYSFVFAHVKGTDNLGHDGNAKGKAEFIEKIDKELSRFLPENYKDKLVIAVCGDHSTPCSFKDHSADPVPVMITSSDCLKDEVQSFGERACYKGGLGRILGKNLMGILLNELHLVEKFGA